MPSMTVGVAYERATDEGRVGLVPEDVGRLRERGLTVLVEAGAGQKSWYTDDAYAAAGATIVPGAELANVDILVCVGMPQSHLLRSGQVVLGLLGVLADPVALNGLAAHGVTAITFDGLPRTASRAQGMDALTSQSNIAGYKAVLVAADHYPRLLPMLITAAGTARPATVLVLGAGVAGLQAIGTARRLGAVVSAYDVRPAAREDIASVGARVVQLAEDVSGAGEGGYARTLGADEQSALASALAPHVARMDVVITTAQVPGRAAPLLVEAAAVKAMAPGSVIVDVAASVHGGNVAGSQPGQTLVTENGVTVIGAANLAATVPAAASTAYSRNVSALLGHLVQDGELRDYPEDEITAGVVAVRAGRIVHPHATGVRS
jgi:H+-translocating NAD(P) transhydrogenase subunit alpha